MINEWRNRIIQGDCLKLLKELPDKSIDLIVTDPPYYKIMLKDHTGKKYDWDNQWDTFERYLEWCNLWFTECKRILKDNGSLYIFADDKISAYLRVELDKILSLVNEIIWVKPNNLTIKGWNNYRCYSPITERILFYSQKWDTNLHQGESNIFEPIRKKLDDERIRLRFSKKDINRILGVSTNGGGMASHYFSKGNKIWELPTEEMFNKLKNVGFDFRYENLKEDYNGLDKEYQYLKKEYDDLRRPFNPEKNYTDVWTFNITSSSEKTYHPTQKPVKLIRRIIKTSSKAGDVVLDPFLGSGTTAVACKQLGRDFIGMELSEEYCSVAKERLQQSNIEQFFNDVYYDVQKKVNSVHHNIQSIKKQDGER